jgi:hypothetical protein
MKKQLVIIAVLMLVFIGFSATHAQTEIGFRAIGGEAGWMSLEGDIESTIGFGARADLGTIFNPKFVLMPEFIYWGKSYDLGFWEFKLSAFYINALVKYNFYQSADEKMAAYGAGGPGIIFGSSKSEWKGGAIPFPAKGTPPNLALLSTDSVSSSSTDIVINLIVGLSYMISQQLSIFGEARYTLGGWDYFGFFAGVMYMLGR